MNEEKKKTKAEALYEKVNILAEKIEKEPSAMKRALYSIKAKMILAKLQRQIDIQKIKQQYSKQRQDNLKEAEESKTDTRSDIIAMVQKINGLEDQIKRNADYDYQSKRFMFGTREIDSSGGINNYVQILKQSGRPEQVAAAQKIQDTEALRLELKNLKESLRDAQEELHYTDIDTQDKNEQLKREEKSLVVRKKSMCLREYLHSLNK